jgi:kynurenine formamidase
VQVTKQYPIPSQNDVVEWFQSLSNWHRWGADDRLGTLNLITAEMRVAAARRVERGICVSCAWDLGVGESIGNRVAPQRWMARSGLGINDVPPPTGGLRVDDHVSTSSEFISLVFHGAAITHLDALSHVHWDGQMFGGVPSSYVTDRDGATVHDVRAAGTGIQARGVLLDVARAVEVDALPYDYAVTPDDLEAAEAVEGVRVEEGDVLLMRTGDGSRRRVAAALPKASTAAVKSVLGRTGKPGWDPISDGQPGLHPACLPWLRDRGVAAIGADGPQEVRPSPFPNLLIPVHAIAVAAMGLWLIDNCQLEDLAAQCNELRRWDFFFSLAPIKIEGATGSPVNPIAIF